MVVIARRLPAPVALAILAASATVVLAAPIPPPRPQAPAASRSPAPAPETRGSFRAFIEALWPAARARGVSRATFDDAFAGVTPNPTIVALTKRQTEFARPIWSYLDGALTPARIARGRSLRREWGEAIAELERRTGVDGDVVLGIWGMETGFGANLGSLDPIRSLATLAYVGYRGSFFRDELLDALTLIERGEVTRDRMRGSWAGAMGHTQFMPSSHLAYAVDGDGDGRRDLIGSAPDALASTANYLKEKGWTPGLPWGFEVTPPDGFDFRANRLSFREWAALGMVRADGAAMPRSGEASLFLPAGARGPAFLVTANYAVIKTYNNSDSYALAVGLLGARIGGAGALAGDWPTDEPRLSQAQRVEVQRLLAAKGFYKAEADGRFGTQTREAVRAFQLARGLLPDGHATLDVLKALRAAR